jgi:hypothetical protein
MRLFSLIVGLLSVFTLTSSQFTYIFEVQDENRGPKSELFGDLSQYKFVPPSQLPRNSPAITSPARIEDRSIRRQDQFDVQPIRPSRQLNRPLNQAEQNQREFVVRAPQQDQRQALLRQQLHQQQFNQPQPQPQPSPQPPPQQFNPNTQSQPSLLNRFQSQPQNALATSQPQPQSFPQLQPHQTAHLTPVLRTLVPNNQPIASGDPNFNSGLLNSFVNSQSRPTNTRPNTALQTLGQAPRFIQPQSQPIPQPVLQSQSSPPSLEIANKQSLTEDDIRAIQEHNKRVQAFLRQREQELATQDQRPAQNQRVQIESAQHERALQERAQRERALRERALQERAQQERALQERAQQERALQERAQQERAHQERAQQERALQRQRALENQRAAQQPRPQPQPQFIPQPQESPVPVHSFNNVRVPDDRRRVAFTPSPVTSRPIPRTTPAPQAASSQNFKPANLGLAALPPDTDSDGIPGEAGRDYPTLETVPKTSFSCARQPLSGYYADTETACQVVHLCQFGGVQDSFLCPNGTIWNQEKFSCQWWYEVNCASAPSFYINNQDLYKLPEKNDKLNKKK